MGRIAAEVGRYRSPAWQDGYLAAMGGLGESCPHPDNSVQAIDWEDGHREAMTTLCLLLDG